MNFMTKGLKRALISVIVFMGLFLITFPSSAEIKQAPLLTLDETQDLVVMFRYDQELIDIVFISPSGKRFDQKSSNIEAASGDLWRTYRIREAEAGDWIVEYDLGRNTQIDYSLVDGASGLWIQSFMITKLSAEQADVSFVAEHEDAAVNYTYKIYASTVIESQSERQLLLSGRALSNQSQSANVDLSGLSSGSYHLILEVQMDDATYGNLAFDVFKTAEFKYVNPNAPQKPDDFSAFVNKGELSVTVDWTDAPNARYDAFSVTVYADTPNAEPIYKGTLDVGVNQTRVYYPEGTQKLIVALNYEKNQVLSDPLIKEIDLAGTDYLYLDEKEITASAQAQLKYASNQNTQLSVSVNAGALSTFEIYGEGFIGLELVNGSNHIYAVFESDNRIFHIVDRDIYLDAYPPEIILYDRLDGIVVNGDSIDIIGEIKYGETFKINETPVNLSDLGVFNYSYLLEPGENVITLTATDQNENTSVQVIIVFKRGIRSGKITG